MVESKSCNISVSKPALEFQPSKQPSDISIRPIRTYDLNAIAQSSPYFPNSTLAIKAACTLAPDIEFTAAADRWMASRSVQATNSVGQHRGRYIRDTTKDSYEQYFRSLTLFFAGYNLGDIQLGNLEAYQSARLQGAAPFIRYRRPQDAKDKICNGVLIPAVGKTACPTKPKKVNQEIGLLMRLMKRADCWTNELEEFYQPLLEDEEEVARALSPEQQRLWLETSRKKERWNVVHWYSIVAFETCMSTDEIRGLRLGDINLSQRVVTVARKTSKNVHRHRTIELVGADVLWALDCLMTVARHHGASDAQHYLFPWRAIGGIYDPTKAMSGSGIKVAWNEVRAATGLTWFRQYDCRHTAITRLAESGVPIDVIMARAGHVSQKMRQHYTHISQASQRKWLEHSQRFHHVSPTPSPTVPSYSPFSSYQLSQRSA
jgi:integrase